MIPPHLYCMAHLFMKWPCLAAREETSPCLCCWSLCELLIHGASKAQCLLPIPHQQTSGQRVRSCYWSFTARYMLKWSLPLPRFERIPAHGHPTDIKTEQVLTLLTTSPVRVCFGHGSSLTSACYLTHLDQYPPRKGENESAPFEGWVALVLAHSYPLCRGKKMRERKGAGKEGEKRNMSHKWTHTLKHSLQQQMEIAC